MTYTPNRAQFRLTGGLKLGDTSEIVTAALRARQCGSHSDSYSDARWYCVSTHARQEFRAKIEIEKQGFRAHLPMYVAARERVRQPKAHGDFRDMVSGRLDEQRDIIRSLFPGYLFVQFDRHRQQWRPLASTIGVSHLFMAGDHNPVPVAPGVVERLMSKGRPWDGVIDDRYRGPDTPTELLEANDIRPGARVRIKSGPFADVHGLCTMSWQKRNELLIQALGGEVRVTVDRADIEVA